MRVKHLTSAITKYQEQGVEQNLTLVSLKNRRNFLKRLVRFLKGRTFNQKTSKLFLHQLREKKCQPSTIKSEVKRLRAFVTFLFKEKFVKENWGKDLISPKVRIKKPTLVPMVKAHQIIVAGTEPGRFDNSRTRKIKKDMRGALRFMLFTGLRVGEVCRLQGNDFNLDDIPPPQFTYIEKGGNERSKLIPRKLVQELRPRVKNDKVFEVTEKGLNVALKRGAEKLGIETKIHCHLLRHIFCYELFGAGVPITQVKELMGHTTLKYTYDTYGQHSLVDLEIALNSLPILREGLRPEEVYEFVEKDVKRRIKDDTRFRLSVDRNKTELVIKVKCI